MSKVSIRHRFVWFFQLCVLLAAGSLILIKTVLVYGSQQAEETRKKIDQSLDEMQQQVAEASVKSPAWNDQKTGSVATADKTIAIINENLCNRGILGVEEGIHEAAKVLGWKVKVLDAGSTLAGRTKAASDVLVARVDGVILDGADAKVMHSRLLPITERGIPIVGWHVGPIAGISGNAPIDPTAVNISTDPLEVARIIALSAIVASKGQAGVVIFTDSNFEIAMVKAETMAKMIRDCPGCTVIEVRVDAISNAAKMVPEVIQELLARYGSRWIHGLTINIL